MFLFLKSISTIEECGLIHSDFWTHWPLPNVAYQDCPFAPAAPCSWSSFYFLFLTYFFLLPVRVQLDCPPLCEAGVVPAPHPFLTMHRAATSLSGLWKPLLEAIPAFTAFPQEAVMNARAGILSGSSSWALHDSASMGSHRWWVDCKSLGGASLWLVNLISC